MLQLNQFIDVTVKSIYRCYSLLKVMKQENATKSRVYTLNESGNLRGFRERLFSIIQKTVCILKELLYKILTKIWWLNICAQ